MPAVTALRAGRRWAESLMVDQCIISRASGEAGPLDPETGTRTPPPTVDIYGPGILPHQGKCKVQTYEAFESKPESGQHVYTVQRYTLHIPVGGPQMAIDDRVEITASELDANLVGRVYRVSGLHHKSLATAQRLLIDEVVA